MRRLWLGLALLALAASPEPASSQVHVSGTVVDSSASVPVPRATIRVVGSYVGTAADEDGQFVLKVPGGHVQLRIGAVGFRTATYTLPANRDSVDVTVQLAPRNIPLGHVTVTADRAESDQNPSQYALRPASLTQVPSFGEPDVIRAAASLPGIAQPNDIDARLNVRGGRSDQNQYLLDGVEIYNPSHLFGLFGAFNPHVTGKTSIHAASFPAEYGGRLSSVIHVRTRTPTDSTYTRGALSLASLSAAHGQSWGDTDVVVGVRRTYLDPVLAAVDPSDGGSLGYRFLDSNLKLQHDVTDHVALVGMGYLQRDHLTVTGGDGPFDEEASSGTPQKSATTWGNALGALRVRANHGAFQHTWTGSFVRSVTDVALSGLTLDNVLRDWTGQFKSSWTGSETRLTLGAQWKRRTFNYGWGSTSKEVLTNVLYGGLGSGAARPQLPRSWASNTLRPLYSGHASLERRLLNDRLTLRTGLRVDAHRAAPVWQPRVRASYDVAPSLVVHAHVGRYAQFMATGYEGQELNVAEPLLPLDRPQTAWSYTGGVTADVGTSYRIRIVGYARTMRGFPRLRQSNASFDGTSLPFRYGTATAYGLDLLAEKTQGWITGQLAYAFGHVRTKFDGGSSPPKWSIPHSLRATLGLRAGAWSVHARGVFHSGRTYTPVIARLRGVDDLQGNLTDRYVFGDRNSERLPLYARFDVSLRRTYRAAWFDWTLYVQALNVLNRRNVLRIRPKEFYRFGVDDTSGGEQQGVQRSLPIVPSVGIELRF